MEHIIFKIFIFCMFIILGVLIFGLLKWIFEQIKLCYKHIDFLILILFIFAIIVIIIMHSFLF